MIVKVNEEIIPFYGIKRFYRNIKNQVIDITDSVFSSGHLFGVEVEKFEKELCKIIGRKYAVSVGSCTDALFFSLLASGIKSGDEVLVSAFSFIASASPILRIGAIPVFVDIDPSTFLMDFNDLQRKISKKTKAIIGVHLFGQTLNINELEAIAKEHKLILIEDAAQGLGARSGKRIAGSMGNMSCLSFDPTKIISAFGCGGALLTDDPKIYSLTQKLRYHGKSENHEFEISGYNSRLSASQCAILTYQIKEHLFDRIDKSRDIASQYNQQLCNIKSIILPQSLSENTHTFHKYVIKTKKRDELIAFLKKYGIESMIHYVKPIYKYNVFKKTGHKMDSCEICESICDTVISLPIFPELTEKEVNHICNSLKLFKT